MTLKSAFTTLLALTLGVTAFSKDYKVLSPDGRISVFISVEDEISYTLKADGKVLMEKNRISMNLDGGIVFGKGDKVRKAVTASISQTHTPVIYKKNKVQDNFNELTLSFKEFDLLFRAYDDGFAYRFKSKLKGSHTVINETARFSFAGNFPAYIPYVRNGNKDKNNKFWNSFENTYVKSTISEWEKGRLAFLPVAFEAIDGIKLCVTESDLLDYPGMYLCNTDSATELQGVFAPYPKKIEQGGHNMLQGIVKEAEPFIAKIEGPAAFPWRAVAISREDRELANSDLSWKLATKCPNPEGFGWVKPGKVAWDWWNNWNIRGVDFESGVNNDTYKYYIDFASDHNIEYIILDEGWAVNLKADLFQVIPEIDLPMLCKYAESKNVGLILWAGYWAFDRDMERICSHYSKMGIKGFKVDFMDRDDQLMVDFYRRAAQTAAKYHMILDFHGAFKPAGLQRTYPNVLNFEGIFGMEQLKWSNPDMMAYDVTIPFIRMLAGPMDYTQGAMKNANKANFRSVYTEPMSQGTRCHQLAEYAIFESPLNMLCDSPSNYIDEPECTEFIAGFPTTWDETVALDGKIGEYVVIARRKGDVWYLGALTNWTAREITADLSFLGEGRWKWESFTDGKNAGKCAVDYTRKFGVVEGKSMVLRLAEGGGAAVKFTK